MKYLFISSSFCTFCLHIIILLCTFKFVFCQGKQIDLEKFLENVTTLFYYNNPGTITILKQEPFPILSGKNKIRRPHIVGTKYVKGRIIAYSHNKFYLSEILKEEFEETEYYDNAQLYINCVKWLGNATGTLKVGLYPWERDTQSHLLKKSETFVHGPPAQSVNLDRGDLKNSKYLQSFHVLAINHLDDDDIEYVRNYIKNGGGLLLSAIPYNHYTDSMDTFWANKVLDDTGIFYIGEHYAFATAAHGEGFNASIEDLWDTDAFNVWGKFKRHIITKSGAINITSQNNTEFNKNEEVENITLQFMMLLSDRIKYGPTDDTLNKEIIFEVNRIRNFSSIPNEGLTTEFSKALLIVDEYLCKFLDAINGTFNESQKESENVAELLKNCGENANYRLLNAAKKTLKPDSFSGWWGIGLLLGGVIVISSVMACRHFIIYAKSGISVGLTQDEIEHFMGGDKNKIYRGSEIEINTDCLPYNTSFEISPVNYNIEKESLLGSGAFGIVYKGSVEGIPVAVKSIKPGADRQCLKSLLSELKILIYLENHPYIVNLVGADTTNLKNGNVFMFVELCQFGNLQEYLREAHKNFQPVLRFDQANNYCRLDDIEAGIKKSDFNTENFVIWCYQIAKALEYLNYKQIIHGDLATRNELVFETNLVKVTDFGLSRKLYHYSEYVKKGQEPLPWGWMAIESLQNLTFSIQSDVWSFGTTMWEIFSFAETPYPGMSWTPNFVHLLKNGLRLQKPIYATNELYQLMLECWRMNAQKRPRPDDLVAYFLNLITRSELETRL